MFVSHTLSSALHFYRCECNEGYEGDGTTCVDINECIGENDCDSRPERGICTNSLGSYTCSCTAGYVINSAKGCDDIDECKGRLNDERR